MTAVLLPPPSSAAAAPAFQVGDRYACGSAHPGRRLEVTVGRLDRVGPAVIVSVAVSGADPEAALPAIGHMPFDAGALATSCPRRLATGGEIPAGFNEGYAQWKAATGGRTWFTISVDKAVDVALNVAGDGR